MTGRRQRIDSITAQVEVAQAAGRELHPPPHVPLTEMDEPFWCSVTAEKPKAEWTDHDLEIAALLSIAMRRLRDEDGLLEGEGSVLTSLGGNAKANPRLRIVADLHARVIKYRQTLGIHNRGKNGEPREVAKRREQAFGVEAGVSRAARLQPPSMQ